jgi:type IV pilus assembly protein PilN
MMRINLLPVKAARKHGSARQELIIFAGILAVSVVGLFSWWGVVDGRITNERARVEGAKRALEAVAKDVTRVEEIKKKAEVLERKVTVVAQLKTKKTGPAKMLDELATILTEQKKVWLTKLDEKDGVLLLEGGAMEHENVSAFQVALTKQSKLFKNVKLLLVSANAKSAAAPGAGTGGVNYVEWKMTCQTNYAG